MRTQIAIIGAGPAGMMLAHLLAARGIDAVVLERRSRDYVEGRVRAGVLEQTTVDVLAGLGLDARLKAEGLTHQGINLMADGAMFRIDMAALTGRSVTVYGQQEVMRDLFDAAGGRGLRVLFEAQDVALHDVADKAFVNFAKDGRTQRLDCDFIAGCDGSHGVSAASVPRRAYERIFPFGWLGILAQTPPVNHELIYANHERGFALASLRSASRSRYYIQCSLDERVEDWPDERFWDEVCLRLGPVGDQVRRAPSFEKSIAPLRSFVGEPMRHGKLFLTGDAAHIVPPAGAKGLNLAVSDVTMLCEGLEGFYRSGSTAGLDHYSARALARVWKAERFSWWFTNLTHRFPDADAFTRRMQIAEFEYLRRSDAMQTVFAENYVGLPLSWSGE